MNTYDTICLSGGGIKGFSFIGALDYLQNKSYIDIAKINNWVGTSAGSILGYLFVLGYSTNEIGDFILDFNFKTLQSEISIDSLLESHGLNKGIKLMLILSSFLKEKHDLEDINFIDLFKLTNKKLTIIGTNFSKGLEAVFNYETHPTMSVITAIRISCSIPVVFEPVLFNGDYYVDGGLINNLEIKIKGIQI
jgi:NTE family protein